MPAGTVYDTAMNPVQEVVSLGLIENDFTPDLTRPKVQNYSIDFDKKTIVLVMSEPVQNISVENIFITNSTSGERNQPGTIGLTPACAVTVTEMGMHVKIILDVEVISAIQAQPHLATAVHVLTAGC